jgi:hypothetical protein
MEKKLLPSENRISGTLDVSGDDKRFRADNSSSCLHRRKLCPGSANMERGLPDERNEFSAEGDLLHWHDARPEVDRGTLTEKQRQILDRNKWLRDRFLAVDRRRVEIPDDAPFKVFRDPDVELFLCDVDGIPIEPPFPGHPDMVIWYPDYQVAYIFDSKFGRIAVQQADMNMQLRSYAVMWAENFTCREVVAAITQPWLPTGEDFHSVSYDGNVLPEYKQEILDILAATRPADAPRNPSIEACTYCKGKNGYCREAIAVATELAVARIKELNIDELEAMSLDIELGQKVIDGWERRMKYVMETKPELVKHHSLSEPQILREIKDPEAAFEILLEVGLLGKDRKSALKLFFACSDVSRNMLEQIIAKENDLTTKDAQERVASALGELIVPKVKARSIVRKPPK